MRQTLHHLAYSPSRPVKRTLRPSFQETPNKATGHVKNKVSRDALPDLAILKGRQPVDDGTEKEKGELSPVVRDDRRAPFFNSRSEQDSGVHIVHSRFTCILSLSTPLQSPGTGFQMPSLKCNIPDSRLAFTTDIHRRRLPDSG